jgi:DNA anti-recombination protein RmuC
MTDYEKDELWKALGRLYDSSVLMKESIEQLGSRFEKLSDTVGQLSDRVGQLSDIVVRLNDTVERLAEVSTTHEKRLDRSEVVIQAILGDLKKLREGRA